MNDPLVSIIIPAYNRAAFLPATLASVLEQDYFNKEIIVIDDGSIDGTPEICAQHPVKYFRQENLGVSAARNNGVKHCCGELLMFLDSDDLCPPGSLRERVAHWQNEPDYAHVTGRSRCFTEESGGQFEFVHTDAQAVHYLFHGAEIITRAAFEKAGGFNETIHIGEDAELWLRMRDLGLRQKLIPEVCLFHRDHAGNATRDPIHSTRAFLNMLHMTIRRRKKENLPEPS